MMGMLLERAPGPLRILLVGKKEQAEGYLVQAAAAGPNYAYIQWGLAEYYVERGRVAGSRRRSAISSPAPGRSRSSFP